jgi:hypothetical protein
MVHRAKVEGMGERGRSRAHGRRQIRADALADMADSGDELSGLAARSAAERKGEKERRWRATYTRGDASVMAGSKGN